MDLDNQTLEILLDLQKDLKNINSKLSKIEHEMDYRFKLLIDKKVVSLMEKCIICGETATNCIESMQEEGIMVYSCKEHIEKAFDRLEDLEIAEMLKNRIENDNGVRYSLDDLKAKIKDQTLKRE